MSAPPRGSPLEHVRRALAGQTKMHAIKKYREENGSGWAAAADAVERIRAGGTPEDVKAASRQPQARPPKSSSVHAGAGIVERSRISPMLVLFGLAAVAGALFGLLYLLAAGG